MRSPWVPALAATGLPGTTLSLPDAPLDGGDWDQLLTSAAQERLSGLLVAAVENGLLPVTDEQRAQAVELHLGAMATVLMLERTMLQVLDLLSDAGVEARVLKGSGVAHLDYAEPALRPFADVDLIVRPAQFDTATSVLSRGGYRRLYPEPRQGFDRRFSKGTTFICPGEFELDLHRTFVMGPFGLSVDLDQLWETSETFRVGGRTLTALGREERLLHACYHAALGDVPPRILPRRDVAEMLLFGDHDIDRMRSLAASWRAEAVVAHAIRSTWETLAIADCLAASAWATEYRPSDRDVRDIGVYLADQNNYSAKSLAALRALPRLRDKAAFLTALAAPQQSYVDGRYRGFGSRLRHGVTDALKGRGR